MVRNIGLAVFLGLALSVGAVAEDGLKEPKVDRPEKSEIEYWDSVIDRVTQPNTDGPLTDAQRKSYLENDTDQLDPLGRLDERRVEQPPADPVADQPETGHPGHSHRT